MNLSEIKVNSTGIVREVKCTKDIKQKFIDMGLVRGVEVKVVRIAAFGDPISIFFKNYTLSIRKEEARNIILESR